VSRPKPIRARLVPQAMLLGLVLFASRSASPQAVSDYQVKAAYMYNFAKFIEWPAQAFPTLTAPIRFCALNNSAFEVELKRVVTGKVIVGHAAEVLQVHDREQARNCNLLFIDSSQERHARQIFDELRGTSVLTVGEAESFIEDGGMIDFVLRNDRVQFRINHKAAKEAGLYISSRLLEVAREVIE